MVERVRTHLLGLGVWSHARARGEGAKGLGDLSSPVEGWERAFVVAVVSRIVAGVLRRCDMEECARACAEVSSLEGARRAFQAAQDDLAVKRLDPAYGGKVWPAYTVLGAVSVAVSRDPALQRYGAPHTVIMASEIVPQGPVRDAVLKLGCRLLGACVRGEDWAAA